MNLAGLYNQIEAKKRRILQIAAEIVPKWEVSESAGQFPAQTRPAPWKSGASASRQGPPNGCPSGLVLACSSSAPGLKPVITLALNAALKGRSSTLAPTHITSVASPPARSHHARGNTWPAPDTSALLPHTLRKPRDDTKSVRRAPFATPQCRRPRQNPS